MAYSPEVIEAVKAGPKNLGNRLGRWCVHLGLPVSKIALATGVSRQSVYNWFQGGEVFVAYRPMVEALVKLLQTSTTQEEAWGKICKAFDLRD